MDNNNTQNDTTTSTANNYALDGKIMLCSVIILFSVVSAVIFFHAFSRRRHVISGHRSGPKALHPALLAALPTFHHCAAADASAPPECSVCLSEFEPGDELRALPRCRHAFHAACIDAWFGSHSDCPLCRSPVAPAEAEVRIAVAEPRDETGCSPAEWCERETRLDLAGLAVSGLGSPDRNRVRVKCSLKRIWSI